MTAQVADAVAAIRAGELAVIPTDTVYGLVCDPERADAVARLSELKRRTQDQPIALVASSLEVLLAVVPELRGRWESLARALLPGPYTLVLPNPARRFRLLGGRRPDTLGVRVPAVVGVAQELLGAVGAVAATSANVHAGPDPRRVEDVPTEITAAAVVVDAGVLPGMPSTVLDLTGPEPAVLREGAVPGAEALANIRRALGQ